MYSVKLLRVNSCTSPSIWQQGELHYCVFVIFIDYYFLMYHRLITSEALMVTDYVGYCVYLRN